MKNGLGFAYYYIDDICVSSDSNTCAMLTTNIQLDQNPTTFSKMFPNPCTSSTTLWTDKSLINATLTVYNSYGQKVKQIDHLSGQTIIFHRDNLTSGLYFIRLTQNSKTFSVDKFVITDN